MKFLGSQQCFRGLVSFAVGVVGSTASRFSLVENSAVTEEMGLPGAAQLACMKYRGLDNVYQCLKSSFNQIQCIQKSISDKVRLVRLSLGRLHISLVRLGYSLRRSVSFVRTSRTELQEAPFV